MTAEDNARSKKLLLATLDHEIMMQIYLGETSEDVIAAFIMNRNRVAKLFKLPSKRKVSYGQINGKNDPLRGRCA